MSEQHMESASEKCCHYGEPGDIDYYYMGLSLKIKRWYGNSEKCSDMLDHWREKDHWLYNYESEETQG